MAVLVALALFVAQAINFGLTLHDRQAFRLEQVVGPTASRLIDAAQGQRNRDISATEPSDGSPWDRFRSRPWPTNPIENGLRRRADVEEGLRQRLIEAGLPIGQVVTGIRPIRADDPRLKRMSHYREQRFRAAEGELLIAIEQPGAGWWTTSVPWQDSDWPIVSRLIGQTLVLYVIVLLPVLWAARRIARPLRMLTTAAEGFHPADKQGPIEESGPHDVRTLIAAFNQLRTRVMAMLDEKDRMLGAIGHDLRTPLAALRVRIESVEDDDDRTKMADTIDEMNGTLDDILSLARLGRPSEPLTEVDVAALVDAVVEDFRDLGKPVSYEEAARLPMRLRPSLIRRAVRNLIENAVKYGGSADVSLTATAHAVRITVADKGPGIPPERVGEVFEAFTRLEGSRNKETGGIGLGLALARAIVREAGGDIDLANRPEGGLAATITLPR
ncbi:HAMP domain-containing histidine kinase [Sphingomonas panacisoli]|uniref:histidine kinase n=1 Tax=Sphingomonas panacisoli TaxID=1813879 RepID=A0A5B8LH06_9SPHN|nr:HAMP domain-containing sensor histidine kinase [Sphingomonas panacisoli]QDZ07149.1 HAMP domain-containing histidine kinase [Sphingomonas panacisoli]